MLKWRNWKRKCVITWNVLFNHWWWYWWYSFVLSFCDLAVWWCALKYDVRLSDVAITMFCHFDVFNVRDGSDVDDEDGDEEKLMFCIVIVIEKFNDAIVLNVICCCYIPLLTRYIHWYYSRYLEVRCGMMLLLRCHLLFWYLVFIYDVTFVFCRWLYSDDVCSVVYCSVIEVHLSDITDDLWFDICCCYCWWLLWLYSDIVQYCCYDIRWWYYVIHIVECYVTCDYGYLYSIQVHCIWLMMEEVFCWWTPVTCTLSESIYSMCQNDNEKQCVVFIHCVPMPVPILLKLSIL